MAALILSKKRIIFPNYYLTIFLFLNTMTMSQKIISWVIPGENMVYAFLEKQGIFFLDFRFSNPYTLLDSTMDHLYIRRRHYV